MKLHKVDRRTFVTGYPYWEDYIETLSFLRESVDTATVNMDVTYRVILDYVYGNDLVNVSDNTVEVDERLSNITRNVAQVKLLEQSGLVFEIFKP